MVGYQGGKRRIGHHLAAVINEYASQHNLTKYMAPFFGCGGVTMHVTLPCRVASDLNDDLIQLWTQLQQGTFTMPTAAEVTKAHYEELKAGTKLKAGAKLKAGTKHEHTSQSMRAAYGLFCTSPLRYMSSFLKNGHNKKNTPQRLLDGLDEMKHEAQSVFLSVEFLPGRDYTQWKPRGGWIIFCDPPYLNACGYWHASTQKRMSFHAEKFCKTAGEWAQKGNHVFVSYNHAPLYQPEHWTRVWSSDFNLGTRTKRFERTEYLWFRGPTESQPMDAE